MHRVVGKICRRSEKFLANQSIVTSGDKEWQLGHIRSAGNLNAKGRAAKQKVEVSSAGGFNGEELQCDETEVNVSSAGHARVCAAKSINAEANSGGSIKYSGNPEKENTSENSGGNVRKVD